MSAAVAPGRLFFLLPRVRFPASPAPCSLCWRGPLLAHQDLSPNDEGRPPRAALAESAAREVLLVSRRPLPSSAVAPTRSASDSAPEVTTVTATDWSGSSFTLGSSPEELEAIPCPAPSPPSGAGSCVTTVT